MALSGYCSTCDKSYPLEDRVAGKILALGATAVIGPKAAAHLPWWGSVLLGIGSIWLGHVIDQQLTLRCPTPTCSAILKIVDAALV